MAWAERASRVRGLHTSWSLGQGKGEPKSWKHTNEGEKKIKTKKLNPTPFILKCTVLVTRVCVGRGKPQGLPCDAGACLTSHIVLGKRQGQGTTKNWPQRCHKSVLTKPMFTSISRIQSKDGEDYFGENQMSSFGWL